MLKVTILLALAALASALNIEVQRKYETLPKDQFVEYFNSQNFTWKIRHHDHVEDMQFGVQVGNISELMMMEHDDTTFQLLPREFDSRRVWSHCRTVHEIYNQGQCGSCWTFGSATVMSDRTCIHRGVQAALSEADFVCLKNNICGGGAIVDAFKFWRSNGLVTLDCLPYDATALRDGRVRCERRCTGVSKAYRQDKHYGYKIYRLFRVDYNIRREIVINGPIQAAFNVYEDFKDYKSGVYRYTYGKMIGRHSVRVLGFGIEGGVHYWLVANSWGKNWGDQGFFKLMRYQRYLGFEDQLISGIPYN